MIRAGRLVLCLLLAGSVLAPADRASADNVCPHRPPPDAPDGSVVSDPVTTPDPVRSLDPVLRLSADVADYDPQGLLFLSGEVTLDYGAYHATSDLAVLDQRRHEARLDGQIRIDSTDLKVQGRDATLNLDTGAAEVSAASFRHPSSGMRGEAERVHRRSERDLSIEDGFFTTCEPEDNSWSFAVAEVELDQESGFGTARHARFQIKGVPVLYVPWFRFPIDDRRQSGFLYPTLGSSNTGSGLFLSTPWYFNIAPHMDATLTPSYIHQRGLHTALEFRHLGAYTYSTLALSGIDRDHYFAERSSTLAHATDPQRWGLTLEQTHSLASVLAGWSGLLHYEAVSDDEYFDDFRLGLHTGNTSMLRRDFETSVVRERWQWSFTVQAPETLDDTLQPEALPYRKLPELTFRFGDEVRGLSLDLAGRYSYFQREQEAQLWPDKVIGSRLVNTLRIGLPQRADWGYLEPALSVHQSDYFLQDYSGPGHLSRTLTVAELDAGLQFERGLRLGAADYRLSLEPRLYYVYVPFREQDLLPEFDSGLLGFQFERLFSARRFSGDDRIADQSRLSAGLTHRWYRPDLGRELARLSVSQVSWYRPTRTRVDGLTLPADQRQYAAALLLAPLPHLQLTGDILWNGSGSRTEESRLGFALHSTDYRTLMNLGYRYVSDRRSTEQGHEQSDTSLIVALSERISVLGRWRYDLQNNRTTGTLAGVEYRACCWRMQLLGQTWLDDDARISNAVLLRFELTGIGSFGTDSEALDQIIPGYAMREARAF
jgi:LPS-assembly protein